MEIKWHAGLLAVVVILAQTILVSAQEGQPLSSVETYELTFADLGYPDKRTTPTDTESYVIYIPGNAVLEAGQNYVDLLFSHTTAGSEFPANLVVTFNDQLAGTIPLGAENAGRGRMQFSLPAAWFKSGYNRLTVALDAEVPCGEEEGVLLLATISADSVFRLGYSQLARSPDLATYPMPFAERSFRPEEVYFVLPSDPTATDIATVATVGVGLGRFSRDNVQFTSIIDSDLTDEIKSKHHLIVVGQMDRNSLLSQLDLPLSLEPSAFSPEYGVIQEIVSPWNPYKLLLVVTGQNAEGVFKAGAALNREPRFLSMKGQLAIVEDILPAEEIEQTERRVDLTFSDLNYGDIVVYGSQMQNVDYYFSMPLAWHAQESPKLRLAFQHAAAVDPEASSLDVHLNTVPVGGVVLDDSNSTDGVLELELPPWLLKPGGNRLTVQVKMDHPASGGDVCVYLDSKQIWTVIRQDSFIHLAYTLQSLPPDLSLFPYPFDTNVNLSDLVLVLPDQLSDEERDGLLRLAVALGAMTGGSQLTLHASTPDELDSTMKVASNLFVVGQPTQNKLIWDLNNYLPQPFRPNSNMPAPGLDSVLLSPGLNRDVGFIQELVSPWNEDRTVLLITGTTDRGISVAFDALLTRTSELKGNLAVIEGDQLYAVDTRPPFSTQDEPSAIQDELPVIKVMSLSLSSLAKIAENWW